MCVSLCRSARRRSTSLSLLCGMCVPCQLAGHQLLPVSPLVTAALSCSFQHRMDSSDCRVCVQCDDSVLCSHFLVYSAVGCEFETLNCVLSCSYAPVIDVTQTQRVHLLAATASLYAARSCDILHVIRFTLPKVYFVLYLYVCVCVCRSDVGLAVLPPKNLQT